MEIGSGSKTKPQMKKALVAKLFHWVQERKEEIKEHKGHMVPEEKVKEEKETLKGIKNKFSLLKDDMPNTKTEDLPYKRAELKATELIKGRAARTK